MMLKSVVLPDPLGPMRAVMVPSRTLSEAPSTACTPPKILVTSCTDNRSVMTHLHRASTQRRAHLTVPGSRLRPAPPRWPGGDDGSAAGGPQSSAECPGAAAG